MEQHLALDQLMVVVDERASPVTPFNWKVVAERFQRCEPLMRSLWRWCEIYFKHMILVWFLKTSTPTASRLSSASTPQRSLKQQLLDRDGWLISTGKLVARDAPEHVESTIARHRGYAPAEIAHIVPYCVRHNRRFIVLLSRFSGEPLSSLESLLSGEHIDEPTNALLMDALTHQEYFVRMLSDIHSNFVCDNDELVLGTGSTNIALPSPLLCNIHLAIGRILRVSGAARIALDICRDEGEMKSDPVDEHWTEAGISYLDRVLTSIDWKQQDHEEDDEMPLNLQQQDEEN
ncbi:hypothetical protein V1504DRAFT_436914 [Lipomyces starkeyi]